MVPAYRRSAPLSDPSRLRVVLDLVRHVLVAWGYRSEHLATPVGNVHWWSADGTGALPPVLVIHGLGSAALNWIPVLQILRPQVQRVMAVDLPGHGFSERPSQWTSDVLLEGLVSALRASGHPPSLVIGHSLGGAAALRYVWARPEVVRGLLLFSPAGAPLDAAELSRVKALFTVDTTADAVRLLRTLHARPAELRARLAAPFVQASLADPQLRAWLDTVQPSDNGDPAGVYVTPDEIRNVPVPLGVVWGRVDRILPESAREYWKAHLPPGASFVEPERIGHTAFLDDRRWTARHIRGFAQGLPAHPDPR